MATWSIQGSKGHFLKMCCLPFLSCCFDGNLEKREINEQWLGWPKKMQVHWNAGAGETVHERERVLEILTVARRGEGVRGEERVEREKPEKDCPRGGR